MGGRTPQAKRRQISRGTILDAAERLFAAHGRDGVTLKAIAAAADVDAALVRYYFGDKEAVFHEMFERRAVVLNGERHAAMDRMEARCGDAITVRDALDTFLRPMFETAFNRGQGWADFAAIAATINSSRAGLHITVDGQPQLLEVDNVVLCAGQEPQRELHAALSAAGCSVHLIGGADVAAELDAKRAILQGTTLAASL